MPVKSVVWALLLAVTAGFPGWGNPLPLEQSLAPYEGPVAEGVDHATLRGTVLCGYQGWFSHVDDGNGLGNHHWGPVTRNPPRSSVDLWPDLTEMSAEEKFPTNFRHADGSPAYVFSSTVKPTVLRHFRWMRDYGIDGVWVQRFASQLHDRRALRRVNTVLSHCREGANLHGRSFAVMYDTGFGQRTCQLLEKDWRDLLGRMDILGTPAYQRHRGRPVIGLWGYGFRSFDEAACEAFFRFLKSEAGGGCTLMAGVPNDWRRWGAGDAEDQARLRLLREYVDVIQPWNVGRYGNPEHARRHFAHYVPGDLAWCEQHGKDYYAVIFPGFSWANLKHGRSRLDQIPRLGGRFLWSQAELVKAYGMDMAYVAMFDEVDEGTAIFKCTNHPPMGRFVTYEGYPSDHYLDLCGRIGALLRGEEATFSEAKPNPDAMTYEPMSVSDYYDGPYPPEQTKGEW
jgi:hypothetical protein